MHQFNQIASVVPLIIAGAAIIILLIRYFLLRQIHHFFLMLVFVLLSFSYIYIWLFCQQEYETITWLFPLRQPVKILLIPACYFYIAATFFGRKLNCGITLLHILPSLFIFLGFIPFWFVSPEVQINYLSTDYQNITHNPIIENVQILRLLTVFIIFNAMLIAYTWLAIHEIKKYKKTNNVLLFSLKGSNTFSIILVFLGLLLVLFDNAYFLGITKTPVSEIVFSILSSVLLMLIFIHGYMQKECITCKKNTRKNTNNFATSKTND